MKIKLIIFSLLFLVAGTVYPQVVSKPNYGLKSPETIEIEKIVTDSHRTVIYLSVENRIQGGNFCADKNIFIIYPDGSKSKLTSSSGIPVCPDAYNFKAIGEKLGFSLSFPPLKSGTPWIDLSEECPANCFSVYGIVLDTALNKRMDEAYLKANTVRPEESIRIFEDILRGMGSSNTGPAGILYVNIISLASEAKNEELVKSWYHRLLASGVPRLALYIKYLNSLGISYQ